MKEGLAVQDARITEQTKSWLKYSDQRRDALQLVQSCQAEKDIAGNLLSILTLKGEKCNQEIDDYNLVNVQTESAYTFLERLQQIYTRGISTLQYAINRQCTN